MFWIVIKWFDYCHNEIRDALSDLAALGYREVICEPLVCDGIGGSSVLIANLRIRGV